MNTRFRNYTAFDNNERMLIRCLIVIDTKVRLSSRGGSSRRCKVREMNSTTCPDEIL